MFSLAGVPLQEDCYLIGESGVLKDACDDAIDHSSAITLLVGLLILFATRTVYCMALVFPSEYSTSRRFKHLQYMSLTVSWPRIKAFYSSFLSTQGRQCAEALASMFGQNMLWCGMFNLCIYGPLGTGTDAGPNLKVLLVAFLGTCLTDSFVIASFIETNQPRFRLCPGIKLDCILTTDDFDEPAMPTAEGAPSPATYTHQTGALKKQGNVRSIAFFVRVLVSLFSNIALWNSAWVLLDLNVVDNTAGRNVIYIALGLWLLYISDAIYGASGVYPARSVIAADTKAKRANDGNWD